MGTSLIRNHPSLGPYRRLMPRVAGGWAFSDERGTPVLPLVLLHFFKVEGSGLAAAPSYCKPEGALVLLLFLKSEGASILLRLSIHVFAFTLPSQQWKVVF